MEDRTVSLINSVPSFAQGFEILLVHNDTLSLINLSSMLEKYSFRVTVTDEAQAAMSMICQHEGQFNLVMAKANMPDMDTLCFLHFLIEKDIPVIFISSGEYNDVTWKALAKGSCYFLEEPIVLQDLKYVWQHVYHTKVDSAKKTHNANCVNQVNGTLGDSICMQKEKRKKSQTNFDSNHLTAAMEKEEEVAREQNYHGYPEKKPRIAWTPELHQKFIDAISVLGDKNNIRPKAILELMNVPNLSARQVSSHLQKYKTQELINQQACISDLHPVRNFSNPNGRSQFSSPFQSQGGFPASTAGLSGSQNQNQFPLNYSETQESDMPQLLEPLHFPYEGPTALSNYGSQNLEAVGGQPIPDASMHQNQTMTAYDTIKMLEEDFDQYDYTQNGLFPDQIDQYSEMLGNICRGESSSVQEPDI